MSAFLMLSSRASLILSSNSLFMSVTLSASSLISLACSVVFGISTFMALIFLSVSSSPPIVVPCRKSRSSFSFSCSLFSVSSNLSALFRSSIAMPRSALAVSNCFLRLSITLLTCLDAFSSADKSFSVLFFLFVSALSSSSIPLFVSFCSLTCSCNSFMESVISTISLSFSLCFSAFCSNSIIVSLSRSSSLKATAAFSRVSDNSFLAFSKFVVKAENLSFIRFLFFSMSFTSRSISFLLCAASFFSVRAAFSLSFASRVCCSNSTISFSRLFFSSMVLS